MQAKKDFEDDASYHHNELSTNRNKTQVMKSWNKTKLSCTG